jgi:import inner membrane translocase subunit TIM9
MDASGMNPATSAAFEAMMQQKQVRLFFLSTAFSSLSDPSSPFQRLQMKDFMALYQNLVERCFTSCCNDFTSKALSSKEVRPFSSFAHALPC